jgi:hypothetical protein
MGILSNLFGGSSNQTQGPPPPVNGKVHSFVEPTKGENKYISAAGLGGGLAGWAPSQRSYRVGGGDNVIDAEGNVAFRPALDLEPIPDVAPRAWYIERNEQKLKLGSVEKQEGVPWNINTPYELKEKPNPIFYGPPLPSRITANHSPSQYRFEVGTGRQNGPIGLRNQTHLNGNHFSAATNDRTYPNNGMRPPTRYRNTYRAAPPSIANPGLTDYSNAEGSLVQAVDTIVQSPSVVFAARSYRL